MFVFFQQEMVVQIACPTTIYVSPPNGGLSFDMRFYLVNS